jgi:hypothetical protein
MKEERKEGWKEGKKGGLSPMWKRPKLGREGGRVRKGGRVVRPWSGCAAWKGGHETSEGSAEEEA